MYEEIIKLVRDWASEELSYAKRLRDLANSLRHPVLRTLFNSIAKDSEKHNYILTGIKEYLENNRPLITEQDVELIRSSIKRHIDEESESINELSRLREKVGDPAILLLIDAVLEDERRHHAFLLQVEKEIAGREVISDEELWRSIWLHSPFHGAPGG